MKILYYDCFSGISGDMNLGALVDLGVPFSYLVKELDKLGLNDEFDISCERSIKNGISGTKVTVNDLNFHNHGHNHNHSYNHVHGRTYKDIVTIIKDSKISEKAKDMALHIFEEIAIAEAKIHNQAISEVHFHEVGAIDSIIDIVGAAIAISYINPDVVKCSTIEIGYGMVNSAHGMLPIPAPATAEILKNIPIRAENVPFEATTPTGAAIIKGTSSTFTDKKNFKILKIGYGIGQKDNKIMANALRVFLGELENNKRNEEDKELILECNIDDMRGEEFELLMERLLKAKALDVFYTNILMKKQRPAIKLSVICNYENKDILKNIIFNNSSTIGIREIGIDRTKLEREIIEIKSKYGFVPLKLSKYNGHIIRVKPEYDYCKAIAIENNLSLNEVYNNILYTYEKIKNENRGI
ncbi:nickel pincer cofactor biosynthesis protein LarC [Clostridium massiliamazoniense]|uniref:nickel pincer cofactor biosynthesis protein LarC n=1 Tax=Clostridium massiliamazoniense TaxID=1347366 RepID=UPI0006D85F27|nr:nickel pincer cofactor biosynthesis protein LarC [Clostridium massiliamazoniense]